MKILLQEQAKYIYCLFIEKYVNLISELIRIRDKLLRKIFRSKILLIKNKQLQRKN